MRLAYCFNAQGSILRLKERIRANLQANITNTKILEEKALLVLKNEELRQIIDPQARIHAIEGKNLV